jgi:hypothetical protein
MQIDASELCVNLEVTPAGMVPIPGDMWPPLKLLVSDNRAVLSMQGSHSRGVSRSCKQRASREGTGTGGPLRHWSHREPCIPNIFLPSRLHAHHLCSWVHFACPQPPDRGLA